MGAGGFHACHPCTDPSLWRHPHALPRIRSLSLMLLSDLNPPPYPHSPAHLFLSPVLEAAHHEQNTQVLSSQDDTETLCDLLLRHHLTPNRPLPELCTLPVVYHPQ